MYTHTLLYLLNGYNISDDHDHILKLFIGQCPYAPTFSAELSKYCCLLNTVCLTHIAIQTMRLVLIVPKMLLCPFKLKLK